MSKEIEAAVDTWLSDHLITYAAFHQGESKEGDWEHDRWTVTFIRAGQKDGMITNFRTDLGLRTKAKAPDWVKNQYGCNIGQWHRQNDKPQRPSAASVLHSLLLGSEALHTSFHLWCSDSGFDTDSIKAAKTYADCCEVGLKVVRLFSGTDIQELRNLLEDY